MPSGGGGTDPSARAAEAAAPLPLTPDTPPLADTKKLTEPLPSLPYSAAAPFTRADTALFQ